MIVIVALLIVEI